MKKFQQLVLVETRNASPWFDRVHSDKFLSMAKLAEFYERRYSLNYERDSITLLECIYDLDYEPPKGKKKARKSKNK